MRFQKRQYSSSVPEVNLVPMMDVLMSVLTFFIITSMSLTGQQLHGINIPESTGGNKQETIDPLIVGLNKQGQTVIANQVVNQAELAEQIQAYLSKRPDGNIILKADKELEYQQVSQLLKEMGKIGGEQVSLAIEKK